MPTRQKSLKETVFSSANSCMHTVTHKRRSHVHVNTKDIKGLK